MTLKKCLLILFLLGYHMTQSQGLEQYSWEHRLVLIMNPEGEHPLEHKQLEIFKAYKNEIMDRDLILLLVTDSEVFDAEGNSVELSKDQLPYSNFSGIILIGKDGGVKLRKPFLVSPQEIFDLIDSMPMRRAEMKKSKQN